MSRKISMQSYPVSDPHDFWSAYVQPRISHIQRAPFFNDPDAIAQALQTIDDDLAAMHVAMCALRMARNALIPVCRLPSEVLARIFVFCADMDPPLMDSEKPGNRPCMGWLRVTHVSRHWRETSLNYPHVWTNIRGLSAHWLKAALARGRSAPISVSFEDCIPTANHGKEVARHVSRIRDLTVRVEEVHKMQLLLGRSMLSSPANVLQHLTLTHEEDGTIVWLPTHIFQTHAPALRSVNLCNVYIPWSAPILHNLTHLTVGFVGTSRKLVTRIPDDMSTMSPFDELLHGLGNIPALQTLDLRACLPRRSRHSIHESIVDLPHLKTLYLEYNHVTRCLDFLNHIRIPSSCGLRLCCDEKEPEWVNEIGSLFHAHVDREHGPIQSLKLKTGGAGFHFYISRRRDNEETDIKHGLEFQVVPQRYTQPLDFVAKWSCSFPIENIHHLHVELFSSKPYWTPQRWINTFGKCSAVEIVEFAGEQSQMLAFCNALATCTPQDTACKKISFLPNLTCCVFGHVWPYDANQREKLLFQKALLKQLNKRQKIKAVQTVRIKWSRLEVSEQFIAELEKIVPEVKWEDDTSRRSTIKGPDHNSNDDSNHGSRSDSSNDPNGDFSDGDFNSDEDQEDERESEWEDTM